MDFNEHIRMVQNFDKEAKKGRLNVSWQIRPKRCSNLISRYCKLKRSMSLEFIELFITFSLLAVLSIYCQFTNTTVAGNRCSTYIWFTWSRVKYCPWQMKHKTFSNLHSNNIGQNEYFCWLFTISRPTKRYLIRWTSKFSKMALVVFEQLELNTMRQTISDQIEYREKHLILTMSIDWS